MKVIQVLDYIGNQIKGSQVWNSFDKQYMSDILTNIESSDFSELEASSKNENFKIVNPFVFQNILHQLETWALIPELVDKFKTHSSDDEKADS